MSETEVKAVARVQVVLEVDVDNWGTGTKLDQVYSQARASALERILGKLSGLTGVRVVGPPKVLAILTGDTE